MALSCVSEKGMNNHTSLIQQQYYHVSLCCVFSAAYLPSEELENNNLTPVLVKIRKSYY